MTCPTCGKTDVHTCSAQYDPDLGQFLRVFNVRYTHGSKTFEVAIKATSWTEAESLLASLKESGIVHNELLEVFE